MSAFHEWVEECEREAVKAVSQMYPKDSYLLAEATRSKPCAADALRHLRTHCSDPANDAKYWVAYHILARTLNG